MTRFCARKDFLDPYDVQLAGALAHREHSIPAEDLDAFNAALGGPI